jgi:hypothetical protein
LSTEHLLAFITGVGGLSCLLLASRALNELGHAKHLLLAISSIAEIAAMIISRVFRDCQPDKERPTI